MGLDMYLYRAPKKILEELNHLKEVERDLYKMWEPIVSNEFPKNWDKSKMTEQQRKLVDERNYEFDVIDQKRLAIYNEMNAIKDSSEKHNDDDAVWFLKRFNTLHKYIVDNFSNGVYDGQVIPLTKDDAGNINQIQPELIKSILPSRMKDNNYYELNGVAYLRNSDDGVRNRILPTINKDVVCQSCGYRFISNYGKHLQIMKRWHNVIHTYDEADEVYNLLKKIKEFKYQITETGSVNVEIKQKEESIANILNEISKCDIERREMYTDYENGLNFIGSFGIDTKPFEIVE